MSVLGEVSIRFGRPKSVGTPPASEVALGQLGRTGAAVLENVGAASNDPIVLTPEAASARQSKGRTDEFLTNF